MALRVVGTAADNATREEELQWFCVRSVTRVDDKRTCMVVNYNNINQRGCVDLIGPRVVVVFPKSTHRIDGALQHWSVDELAATHGRLSGARIDVILEL